jgi:hypothetical protein
VDELGEMNLRASADNSAEKGGGWEEGRMPQTDNAGRKGTKMEALEKLWKTRS